MQFWELFGNKNNQMLKKLYFSCKHSDLHEAEVDYLLYDYA